MSYAKKVYMPRYKLLPMNHESITRNHRKSAPPFSQTKTVPKNHIQLDHRFPRYFAIKCSTFDRVTQCDSITLKSFRSSLPTKMLAAALLFRPDATQLESPTRLGPTRLGVDRLDSTSLDATRLARELLPHLFSHFVGALSRGRVRPSERASVQQREIQPTSPAVTNVIGWRTSGRRWATHTNVHPTPLRYLVQKSRPADVFATRSRDHVEHDARTTESWQTFLTTDDSSFSTIYSSFFIEVWMIVDCWRRIYEFFGWKCEEFLLVFWVSEHVELRVDSFFMKFLFKLVVCSRWSDTLVIFTSTGALGAPLCGF